MVNPQVSLLDLTVKAGIPCNVMRAPLGDNNIVSVPHHDRLLVDMVNESIQEDLNITCDEALTQPTRGVAVTAFWQIVSTPPALCNGCPITVFV